MRAGAEVYAALKARLTAAGFATGLGDEGGFAPDISRPEDVLDTLVGAITDAGYTPGPDGCRDRAWTRPRASSPARRPLPWPAALSSGDMVGD